METENTSSEFLLLIRNQQWDKDLSPDEIQQSLDKFMAWFNDYKVQGKIKDARPLQMGGKIVSGKDGKVADGPFAESKEEVGGFFLLDVPTIEEAVEIARQCPTLGHDCTIEVRHVALECASLHRLKEQAAGVSA